MATRRTRRTIAWPWAVTAILVARVALGQESRGATPDANTECDSTERALAPFSDLRLAIGTRVRLLPIEGSAFEGRLAGVCDGALVVHRVVPGAAPSSPETIRLNGLRSVAMHTEPANRRRVTNISVVVGAVAGLVAGALAHDDTHQGPAGFGDPPSLAENMTVGMAFGAGAGWLIGRYVLGRRRWVEVTLR